MALINRISRLFRADMHAVLDRIEEPETLLRQALREMETAHADDCQRSRLLQHEAEQLARQEADSRQRLEQVEEELDICFNSGKETLARQLVRKKLELIQQADQLRARGDTLQQQIIALQQRMQENSTRLESLRQKLALLESEQQSSGLGTHDFSQSIIRDQEVEVAFLREQHKRRRS